MAGGTGTDVRGDRLGRSPKSPTSGNRLRAAVSCGRGRRAMADAPSAPARGQVGTPCGARGPPRSTGAGEGSTGASSGLRLAAAAPALRLVADRGHPTRSPPRLKRGTCQRRARLGRPRRETRGARQLGRWDRGRLARCPHRLLLLVSTALARPVPPRAHGDGRKPKDQRPRQLCGSQITRPSPDRRAPRGRV